LFKEGLEWCRGSNFRVADKARGKVLVEAAAAGQLPLAVAHSMISGWGGYSGSSDDTNAAFNIWQEVAAAGGAARIVAEAEAMLGRCYDNGDGVAEDEAEAARWYRKAADRGHSGAQNDLGSCYYNGEGVAEDKAEAARWHRKAADQGHSIAQNNLGDSYYNGEGVAEDKAEAARWYRKAAEQGHTDSIRQLVGCYRYGVGVEKDEVEAARLWCTLGSCNYPIVIVTPSGGFFRA
jgi:TPR repeat protein